MEVDWIDAAILAEELFKIYSTPTPKGWSEPKKVIDLYLIDCFFTIAGGLYLYPGLIRVLNEHDYIKRNTKIHGL